jgi:hypothetical protein
VESLLPRPELENSIDPKPTLAAARETRLDAAADPGKFDILQSGPGREGAIN